MIPPSFPFVLSTMAHSVYLTSATLSDLDAMRYRLCDANPKAAIRWIRGTRCHSEPALFDEFAAALQFPSYFGHNWDALVDCLSDLPRWVQAEQSLLMIADADHILCHDSDLPVRCFEVLHSVIVERNVALRVVLHCGKTDPAYDFRRTRLLGRLDRAKITPVEIG